MKHVVSLEASRAAHAADARPFVDLIDEHELSRRTGISASTLRTYRCRGTSPPFLKVGKHVRYDWADVCAWLAAKRRHSTAPTATEKQADKVSPERTGKAG